MAGLDTEVTLKFNLSLGLKHYHSSYWKLVHKVVQRNTGTV